VREREGGEGGKEREARRSRFGYEILQRIAGDYQSDDKRDINFEV